MIHVSKNTIDHTALRDSGRLHSCGPTQAALQLPCFCCSLLFLKLYTRGGLKKKKQVAKGNKEFTRNNWGSSWYPPGKDHISHEKETHRLKHALGGDMFVPCRVNSLKHPKTNNTNIRSPLKIGRAYFQGH